MKVWACDFRENSGEGRLARLYFNKNYSNYSEKIEIITPEANYIVKKMKITKYHKKKVNYESFFYKYFYPLLGCSYSWYYFLLRKKFTYINYLPLWNILIFIFLAPGTKLGPVTGSKVFENKSIRSLLIPLLYKLSIILINLRYPKIIFATNNLKKYFKNNLKGKKFNFIKNYLKKNVIIKTKKKYDAIIYFRKHSNKNVNFFVKISSWMIKNKLKVICYGDKLDMTGIINVGFINHKKSIELIKLAKIGINSSENFYTFFMMDCINNNINVLCDQNSINEKQFSKTKILVSDYKNFEKTCKKLSIFFNL